ncbi:endoribonuclease YicC domain-containing protein, partial [Poseidonibacter lekithochrous]|uniref:endoribonuclease YicC domain-containing protein n=1 Tax=Poseidonibacter lekithochrous TaxID=1904463 RepID=UPI000E5CB7BD
RLDAISAEAGKVRALMQEIMTGKRERIMSRLDEAKIEFDANRLEQELVMLAQKSDVAEELDRLDSHVKETQKILKKGGACG